MDNSEKDPYDFSDIPVPEKAEGEAPTLAQMVGEYAPVEGTPFWVSTGKMTLRVQSQIVKLLPKLTDDLAAQIEVLCEAGPIVLKVREGERFRPATYDEVLDGIDMQTLSDVLKQCGLSGKSPNAAVLETAPT